MMKHKSMDRIEIFSGEKPCKFLWCLQCERAYKWGGFREINGIQMCPYDGCNGDTVLDGWTWDQVLEANPDYPKAPELGKHYPLYRSKRSVKLEFKRFQQASKVVGGLLFPAQAAEILGLSRQRLNSLVASGILRQHNFFGRPYLAGEEISKFLEKERKTGRPRKVA